MSARRQVLLRVDPAIHDALTRWAADEFRSLNAHIEMLLRRALADAGRLPRHAGPPPRRGRPPTSRRDTDDDTDDDTDTDDGPHDSTGTGTGTGAGTDTD